MLEKIIVVTNSERDSDVIKETLLNNTVMIANNIYEALLLLDAYSDIKLMFLDIDLPEMSSYHLLALLKMNEKYDAIRVIIMSHNPKLETMLKGPELSSVDYLHKPIDPEPLKLIVRLQSEIINQKSLVDKMSGTNYVFDLLFNEAPFGIAITKISTKTKDYTPLTVSVNPSYERIVGRKEASFQSYDWRKITHPDDLKASEVFYERLVTGEIKSYVRKKRYIHPDGKVVWVNMVVSAIGKNEEEEFSFLTLIEDITESTLAEQKLQESERSKSVLLSHLPGMAYRCYNDREWTMLFVSEGCYKLTGYRPDALLNNKELSYNDLIMPSYRELLWKEWKRVIAKKEVFRQEYQIITATGEPKWVLELGEPIYDSKGKVEALEGIVIDISEQKMMEDDLQHKNDYNEWTELLNRNYLERFLYRELKTKKSMKRALLVVNLNSIQTLTPVHGYHYSQDLMKRIADELKKNACEKCELFLTHENRLTFFIKDYNGKDDLLAFYERIAAIIEPIVLLERISCGVGIYELTRHDKPSEVDNILKKLLLASEEAYINDDRPMHYVFFDEKMEAAINREKDIQIELVEIANGINEDRLFLQYQPIIDLSTNKVSGLEALVRLRSEKHGIVPPLDFIPLMERTKLIIPIGERITYLAIKFLKHLEESGYGQLSISINVSAIQLLDSNFTNNFLNIIKKLKANPNKIWVELTESVFATNYQEINAVLGGLIAKGIRVAIDDFGTGFSSLHRLLAININAIKIDKAFMDGIEFINIDEAITKDIVSLGQKLRYIVVAEGVESEIQKDYLMAYGCDRAQGYYFSKPLNEEEVIKFIKQYEK